MKFHIADNKKFMYTYMFVIEMNEKLEKIKENRVI